MSRRRKAGKAGSQLKPPGGGGIAHAIAELRVTLPGPFVRVRVVDGGDVRCRILTVAFRCPACKAENMVGIRSRPTAIERISCAECSLRFEIEFG